MTSTPPVHQMIKQIIEELGGSATNTQIREAALARYPDANPNTINAQINICTVNSPSRINYPENSRQRVASDPRYDFLYRVGRGQVELYDPTRHGAWEILRDADGHLHVALSGEGSDGGPGPGIDEGDDHGAENTRARYLFSLERHLRDFLAANIGSLDLAGGPLSLVFEEAGHSGVEYRTDVGPVDILALDAGEDFVVFELKLDRGPDVAVGQLARYMGWVKHNLGGHRSVRGVIVARTVDEKLRYAASVIPNVSLFEYTMSFTLQPADDVSQ